MRSVKYVFSSFSNWLHLQQFGIYADGLESLIGQAEGNNEEAENNKEEAEDAASTIEPTAGMSFTFMDVLLTQVEFFRGLSGLMSAAWNAPTELTSALQVCCRIFVVQSACMFH